MEQPFHPEEWDEIPGFSFTDITYHRAKHVPAVRVAINRPEVRNAFRPQTVDELYTALDHARMSADIACVLLTGNGPSPKDGGWAFCSGGDQRVRGPQGYEYAPPKRSNSTCSDDHKDDDRDDLNGALPAPGGGVPRRRPSAQHPEDADAEVEDGVDGAKHQAPHRRRIAEGDPSKVGWVPAEAGQDSPQLEKARLGRLHILEVQRLIRFMPKPVIALVNGWAAGGGHSLHVVCDLTIASREHAKFKQTDADVGSFDAGFGSAYLARQVGQKFAREIFFLGQTYDAARALQMGAVNAVVPHGELETIGLEWAEMISQKSPTAIRMLKYAFNAIDDGLVGQQIFAGETTRLAYMTDEAREGRDAFLEKRDPDWSDYPYYY